MRADDGPLEIRVPEQAPARGSTASSPSRSARARRRRALIDAGRVRVDGAVRPKRHAVRAGERIVVGDGAICRTVDARRAGRLRDRLRGRAPAGRRQAGRRRRASRPRPPDRARSRRRWRARRRRRGALARRDRPPPRPRHLGAARRRQERRGPPRAEGAAVTQAAAPRVPGARRRASAGAHRARSTRRSAATAATAC